MPGYSSTMPFRPPDVRNMAKLFEQTPADTASKKPPIASKPKQPWVKPEITWTGNETDPNTDTTKKPAVTVGQKPRPLNGALAPKLPAANNKSPDSNNNKSSPFKETNSTADTKDNSSNSKALMPQKFPKSVGANNAGDVSKPPTLPKSPGTVAYPKPVPSVPTKVALLPKITPASKPGVSKSDSVSSSSSSTSSSSSDSSTPSTLTSPSSASSLSKPWEKGHFDFSKNLRPAAAKGVPPKKLQSSTGDNSTAQSAASPPIATSPPPLPKSTPPSSTPTFPSRSDTQIESTVPKPDVDLEELRSKLRHKCESIDSQETNIIERQSDGKKFRKISLDKSTHSATAPEKPTLPADVDLMPLRNEYEKASSDSKAIEIPENPDDEEEDDVDELYTDSETVVESRPKMTVARPISERCSMIPEMSPEEEGALMDDLYSASESVHPNEAISINDTAETSETEQEKRKKKQKEEADAKKREKEREKQEKQKKRKEEKEEKQKRKEKEKEEKLKKKKEEEDMKLKEKFKLTGEEKTVGEGVIKNDASGDDFHLKVRKGQMVTIIRMDHNQNPQNKWLVKAETSIGYVDSNNISVDPNIIKQKKIRTLTLKEALLNPLTAGKNLLEAMTNHRKESAIEDFDLPTYDAVPEDSSVGTITPAVDDEMYEDVYEFCP